MFHWHSLRVLLVLVLITTASYSASVDSSCSTRRLIGEAVTLVNTKMATKKSSSKQQPSDYLFSLVWIGAILYGLVFFLQNAYQIRLLAIEGYGRVIHEFDPYFNWRATQYLYENGREKFFKWFDHMVWYPLVRQHNMCYACVLCLFNWMMCYLTNDQPLLITQGRPVGTTIYPGMQFTAVFLKNHIFGDNMSLNDICVFMPAWFGVAASFLVGCIAYEASWDGNSSRTIFHVVLDALTGRYAEAAAIDGSNKPITGYYKLATYLGLKSPAIECAVCAIGFMAVTPAHLMRSVGGGYDNESVAVTAMTLTFYLWMRSLRTGEKYSYLFGILAGVAYFYMVAAWGGYIFVLNMIGAHAALLVLLGRFSNKVYLSYTLFYVIGTSLAIQVPVVGWSPLKSLEQLAPCAVFLGYQALQYCEVMRKKYKMTRAEAWKFRIKLGVLVLIAIGFVIATMTPKGYFGPISSRVRGLFVPHTKTGNPLVDSVAEHQAASSKAYWQYLHIMCVLSPMGFVFLMFRFGDSASFLFVYGFAAYFFSHKMVRLILLTAPIASALSGIAVGRLLAWCLSSFMEEEEVAEEGTNDTTKSDKKTKDKENGKPKSSKKKDKSSEESFAGLAAIQKGFDEASKSTEGRIVKGVSSLVILGCLYYQSVTFKTYCWQLAPGLSNPSIILKGTLRDGTTVVVDDYREAYWWLRDNTPEDARIMAWWDYGYQIAGIANRTTIADGNTWNHEHIALLGKALTGTEEEGYQIARHLADYVLVWGGGGGDDLAKSPHLARIANSVYRDHCPGDVTCRAFGFIVSFICFQQFLTFV